MQNGNDPAACHALANLCVLQQYDPSSMVCAVYQTLLQSKTVVRNGFSNWYAVQPLFADTRVLVAFMEAMYV